MGAVEVHIRDEQPGDQQRIAEVVSGAFGSPVEARIVENLRRRNRLTISLVAIVGDDIVGHIAFSPVRAENDSLENSGLGLGPLAVAPALQCLGVGCALVETGLERCRSIDAPYVVVLGDPRYYARFGFLPGPHIGLRCNFGGGDAFQYLRMDDCRPQLDNALVVYDEAFDIDSDG